MLLLLSLLASAQALPIDHGNSPTVLQYVLEAVVDLPNWSRYLPDDIDVDKDGNLNEKEVELKFKSYVKDVFDQLDKDVNKLVTQEEFRNASINLNGINKIIDIAMQSYPIKMVLGFGDRNQDGFIAEDDFLIPENRRKLLREYYTENKYWGEDEAERGTNWTLTSFVPTFITNEPIWGGRKLICSESFGEKEAQVLCREMGHTGVESVSSTTFEDYESSEGYYYTIYPYGFIFDCQGTEASLDECRKSKNEDAVNERCPGYSKLLATVKCTLNKEIGKVKLAGGKDASGDLHIGLEKYCGDISPDMAKVVCTELGFVAGTPLVTRNNFFTSRFGPPSIERRFECNGSEQKLQDCQAVMAVMESRGNGCDGKSNGIICKPDKPLGDKYGIPPGVGSPNPAFYNDGEDGGFYYMWERLGRYLLVADQNGDHKVSMEELKTKIKEIVAAVFQVLDQTDDGVFSVSDLTTLNVKLPDVLDLARKIFQVLAKGEQQIDLYSLAILKMSRYNRNRDNIINLKDLSEFIDSSQVEGLLTILSRELDPNQDGIILVTELDNYVEGILDHLGGGTVTLDTIWNLMKKSQFTCLQINGVRTSVEGMVEFIKTQSSEMLDYFFRELDLDGNGEIPVEELYNAHVPCDEVEEYRELGEYSDRVSCGYIMYQFFFDKRHPKVPRLDHFNLNRRPNNGNRGSDFNNGNRGSDNFNLMEKLANSACVAMQPDF